MNRKAEIAIKPPFGDIYPFLIDNLVEQGTVPGPILNNCSLDKVCKQGASYHNKVVVIKPFEFVDDIADQIMIFTRQKEVMTLLLQLCSMINAKF